MEREKKSLQPEADPPLAEKSKYKKYEIKKDKN